MNEAKLRATLIDRLQLPADADDQTIIDALADRVSEKEVAAAIKSGKVLAAHKDYWVNAMKSDVVGTRQVLASLASPKSAPTTIAAGSAAAVTAPPLKAPPPPSAAASAMSAQDLANAQADAELWSLGFRGDGLEEPPKPKWYELFPPNGA